MVQATKFAGQTIATMEISNRLVRWNSEKVVGNATVWKCWRGIESEVETKSMKPFEYKTRGTDEEMQPNDDGIPDVNET
jgi:hypothetical protein